MNQEYLFPDFVYIPHEVYRCRDLSPVDILVFGILYWRCNGKLGKCVCSNDSIAESIGYHGITVSKSIARLEKNGFILVFYDSKNHRESILINLELKRRDILIPDDDQFDEIPFKPDKVPPTSNDAPPLTNRPIPLSESANPPLSESANIIVKNLLKERFKRKDIRLSNFSQTDQPTENTNNPTKKVKHLEFVLLTEVEKQKLYDRWGQREADVMIAKLNNYIGSTGKRYKSHYHTLLVWHEKDNGTPGKRILSV